MKKIIGGLSACLLMAGVSQAEIITTNITETADTRINDTDNDGAGNSIKPTIDNNRLIGYYYKDNGEGAVDTTLNMTLVYAFLMTGVTDPSQITAADFSVTQSAVGSDFDINASIIRTSDTADFEYSDYQTIGTSLMEDFSSNDVVGSKSLDTTGQSSLVTYLQNNWVEGQYVFISLQSDPLTLTGTASDYAKFNADGVLSVMTIPESATIGMLGLGAFLLMAIRKQDRS